MAVKLGAVYQDRERPIVNATAAPPVLSPMPVSMVE